MRDLSDEERRLWRQGELVELESKRDRVHKELGLRTRATVTDDDLARVYKPARKYDALEPPGYTRISVKHSLAEHTGCRLDYETGEVLCNAQDEAPKGLCRNPWCLHRGKMIQREQAIRNRAVIEARKREGL